MIAWVYQLATGQFLYGGFFLPDYDPATQGLVTWPDEAGQPDRRLERFDAATPTKRRPATTAEIAAFDDALKDAEMQSRIEEKWLKAVVVFFAKRVNELRTQPTTVFPALTVTDVKQGIVAEYKVL